MTPEEFTLWLRTEAGGNCSTVKIFEHGLYAATKPLLYHWTLIIGQVGNQSDYLDHFCYETRQMAEGALNTWNGLGQPEGWHRHPRTGRRRPDGDKNREYVAW